MVTAGSMMHLERMGSELKCPVCLSLYKSAATISCNHTFCRSCILESVRATSCCPICKAHTTRREVRPAPQMDSLVDIFKGMESAAGICLFPTQSTQVSPPEKLSIQGIKAQGQGRQKTIVAPSKKTKAANKALDPRKKRRRSKSNLSESDDSVDENYRVNYERALASHLNCKAQGVVLAKKRVQVPKSSQVFVDLNLNSELEQDININDGVNNDIPSHIRTSISYRPEPLPSSDVESNSRSGMLLDFLKPAGQDVPLQHQEGVDRQVEKSLCDSTEVKHDHAGLNLDLELQGFPSLRQAFNELPQLTPFFWLHNDPTSPTEDELFTQAQLSAPALRPAFSDLKDSDDEGSLDDVQQPGEERSCEYGEGEGYDSDTFAWTQRPCSPELACSPTTFREQSGRSFKQKPQGEEDHLQNRPLQDPLIVAETDADNSLSAPNNLHHQVLTQSVQVVPAKENSRKKPLGDRKENVPRIRRHSVVKNGDDRSPISTTSESVARPACPEIDMTAGNGTERRPTRSRAPSSTEIKECAAVASRFLDLLRDGHPEAAPQRLLVEDGVGAKVSDAQVEESNKERLAPVAKSKAASETTATACRFCGNKGNSEVAGEMMRYPAGSNKYLHVHKLCAEWAPNVYFEDDDRPRNLSVEVSRGGRIKCTVCGRKGAALGCCNNKCKNSYHYPCARLLQGCQWNEDDYVMFCPLHARGRAPKARRQSGDGSSSTLETQVVDVPSVPAARSQARSGRRAPGPAICEETRATQWSPGPAAKWVLCGSGLDSKLKVQVASFATLTGATVVTQWSSAVTHVITWTDEQGAAKRTLKYLLAMLEGKWIVRIDWINECLSRMRPVPEDLYLVTCDVNGFYGGPCLSRHLAVSKAPKLFEDISFYLCGDFTSVLKADLQSLITAGGGTVLHRRPLPTTLTSFTDLSDLQETPLAGQTIVLYNADPDSGKDRNLANRIQEAMSISIPARAHALPCTWLLDSIAHCRLLPPN
ncbi:BRCA1-associated RING domain protein 1 [Marchantia polymorpha subsp. ruderalis]|uniref:RING-type E3 ubiquitin transferase BRCA1 n=2 Tax=Marchantia polymorpha TaxID=3197 RepID=A0AAF6AJT8_MARPO|nr:hypothetical protein MARPO_0103s0079 [Marchantia polymorpha]BBM96708.1 hypothetical protein Mp_1g00070 [Marchantia polymorpha subsp. ruderalis]|eukprot:PTQ32120.1 hypothetical protein MARPO_0103s0079 [Marchantia polymorpha]